MLQQHQKCKQENLFSHFPHLPQRTLDVASVAAATEVKLRPMCLRFVSHFCWGQAAAVAGGSGYLTTLKFQLNSFELRPESVNRNELWTAIVTAVASLYWCQRISLSLSQLQLHWGSTWPAAAAVSSQLITRLGDRVGGANFWNGKCLHQSNTLGPTLTQSLNLTRLNSTELNSSSIAPNSIQFHRDPLSLSLSLAFSWQCFVAKFQLQLQLLSTSSRLFKLQYSKLSRPRYHTHLQHRLDSHSLLSLKREWWRGEGEEYIISQLGSFILCAVSKSCVRAPTFPKL